MRSSTKYFLSNIGFDTAETKPCNVFCSGLTHYTYNIFTAQVHDDLERVEEPGRSEEAWSQARAESPDRGARPPITAAPKGRDSAQQQLLKRALQC